MTKKQFVRKFEDGMMDTRVKFIAVVVDNTATGHKEIISFERENFQEKLDYYKTSYNDNMELNSFTKIRITNIRACKAITYNVVD